MHKRLAKNLRTKREMLQYKIFRSGFSLIEIMIAMSILIFSFTLLVRLFIHCLNAGDSAKDLSIAMGETQGKLEEIRNYSSFSSIVTDYGQGGNPGNIFSLNQLNATGVIYINSSNTDLLEIEIVTSLRTVDDRVIGEDQDLDGILDGGEDVNGNGKFDSPVSLVSVFAKR